MRGWWLGSAAVAAALCAAPPAPAETARDTAAELRETDKRARRGRFDALAALPCAQERGEALGTCDAGVARGDGVAVVVATFPNGFARRLRFAGGRFVSADTTMSGTGTDIDWVLRDGVHVIRVDDQRYDIPHAFVFGVEPARDEP